MKIIETKNAPAAIGPYSQAVVFGDLIYTSSQIPIDPATGRIETDTIKGQTEQIIKNLSAILTEVGSSLDSVIKTTCYLKDIRDFGVFNEVYGKHFTSKPSRSCVEVSNLPKGALAEIEVIAEVEKR